MIKYTLNINRKQGIQMKNNKKLAIFSLTGLMLLSIAGCGKTAPAAATASASEASTENPDSVNENITTVSTYYEEAEPAAETGSAEGFVPDDIPKGTLKEIELKKAFTFTEKGQEAYSVTIDKAEFTDRRSEIPGMEAEKVLLITYTYESLNGEPRLVDDMSFRLFQDETAYDPYYLSDQIMADISSDAPYTAEVCFAVPEDAKEFSLFVVDNAEENNENYHLALKF